jgi:hypothetical protein
MAIPLLPLLGLAVQAAPQVARWLGGEQAAQVTAQVAERGRRGGPRGRRAGEPRFIWVSPALSVLILGLFAATFYALSVEELRNKDILNILVGGLTASVAAVIQYWFGSSAGSRAKDETVRSLAARPGG